LEVFEIDVLIDYFSFTSKVHSWSQIIEFLGLQEVQWVQGKARNGWTYHDYNNGMHIYHGGRFDVGVELSGAGCRMLETCHTNAYDWLGLFEYIVDQGDKMNVSRLDVAGDDKSGLLQIETITRYTEQDKYISKARRRVWMGGDEQGVVFGATSSDTRLRIYNKALERGVPGPWVRVEFQLRDAAADSFILNLLQVKEIGKTYSGVLLNYLRYVTRRPEESQNNYDRIPTVRWWAQFVGTVEKIKNITVGGLEYNYWNLEAFIVQQCASSLKAYLEINKGDVGKLLELISSARLNPKQQQVVYQVQHGEF
jgi:DNA relaxase NicK